MGGEGVNVAGYFRAEAGVGESARLLVEVLRAARIPYTIVPVTRVPTRQANPWNDWRTRGTLYDTNIICVNADQLPEFVADSGREFIENRYSIGMWWWEVEHFPEWMRHPAKLVDEIWAGSRHSADAIRATVDRPVFVCPPAVTPPRPAPLDRERYGIPGEPFFLFCFDFNSDFERKNPLGLVRAYQQAFDRGEGPPLVLKSMNGHQRPRNLQQLVDTVAGRPDIHVLDRYLDVGELHGLMAGCAAYVSLHRAEGFGLTIAEAMALGKPAIATAYSGNVDFMTDENSYLVPFELGRIPRGCDPYPEGARWAEPDLDAAAELLRRVVNHPAEATARGERGRLDMLSLHSPAKRAPFLTSRLQEVRVIAPRPRPRLSPAEPSSGDPLVGDLWTLHAHADLPSGLVRPARPGRAVSTFRRFLLRLLFPLVHRQTEYNIANMRVVESIRAALASHEAEIAELSERVELLERGSTGGAERQGEPSARAGDA